ncbi:MULTISPECIES: DUF3992 domain-containing protein [Bacillus]|uniref:DUF3992 domain-containing protein n=1 Tax=Bacillus cereus TaxID=1396 RepID=A0A2C1LNZ0_BACCE|nr:MULTISPECIES: S-Ena type endospore appendage [Bacillus]MDH4422528.1 DUF3992 domain-containing protein [Bacillus cereus]PER29023.1 DUF3992 domain-containing protein [Bacillus cereus]PFA62046.1 DUF3992 domain-containing protein [Bacillus sp. AFS015896]PGL82913.1 DUF3992 domain-containing protein [Bacillus sp. AFS054943]PGT99651.1 DUF3992 domain-containing protein [Bacillus cereus]
MSCECSGTVLTCCSDDSNNFVQDKVCNPWSSAAASTFTVYTNNVNQNIVGTGYLTYDVGPGVSPANQITVAVLGPGGGTIQTFTVSEGTSISFTFRRFDIIQITTPAPIGTYQGEFCITTRYLIS